MQGCGEETLDFPVGPNHVGCKAPFHWEEEAGWAVCFHGSLCSQLTPTHHIHALVEQLLPPGAATEAANQAGLRAAAPLK